jgi:hypothetical protein
MICAEDYLVAKSKQDSAPSFKLRYASEVTVRVPEFHPLPSLQYLDAEALSRASKAKIDIGFFKSPCCERHVQAVIERGMVVGLDIAPCAEPISLPAEAVAFVKTALKRVRRGSPKWKPVPVKEFLARQELPPGRGETNCVTFTIFGREIFCCQTDDGPVSCILVAPFLVDRL